VKTSIDDPRSSVAAPAVQLREASKTYLSDAGPIHALRGVSADFPTGTFTAIMGPSGSGKSTLLHCAAGLDRTSSGQVLIAGNDLTGRSEKQLTLIRREHVGFVFQAYNLVSSLNVWQNLALAFRLAGRKPPKDAIAQALREVGLGEHAGRYPGQLSGGQQQRVAIARALVTRPAVLFTDEPTGALDLMTSREVLALLRRSVDQQGQTIVMVTHSPTVAAAADRVLFIADGQITGELSDAPLDPMVVAAHIAELESV
jgi:putative ABC transport system ATP-binding protein